MNWWKCLCCSSELQTAPLWGSTQHSVTKLSSVSTSRASTSVSLSSSVEKLETRCQKQTESNQTAIIRQCCHKKCHSSSLSIDLQLMHPCSMWLAAWRRTIIANYFPYPAIFIYLFIYANMNVFIYLFVCLFVLFHAVIVLFLRLFIYIYILKCSDPGQLKKADLICQIKLICLNKLIYLFICQIKLITEIICLR